MGDGLLGEVVEQTAAGLEVDVGDLDHGERVGDWGELSGGVFLE